MNFTNYTFNKNYYLYNIEDDESREKLDPNQRIDDSVRLNEKISIFPSNIYNGQPMKEPNKKSDLIDYSTTYFIHNGRKVYPNNASFGYTNYQNEGIFPHFTTKYGKLPPNGKLCPFGYCSGVQSGRNYMCAPTIENQPQFISTIR